MATNNPDTAQVVPANSSNIRPKHRSLSDSVRPLEPSPKLNEPSTTSRDDNVFLATPSRLSTRARSFGQDLGLQVPMIDITQQQQQQQQQHQQTGQFVNSNRPYPSNSLEPRESYGSPTSVLPRHSRGMDFSRACTNLHHSTLPDTASPDSSPTVNGKHFAIPSRRGSVYSMMVDSPQVASNRGSMHGGSALADKWMFPRSQSSTNAMASEASSDSSDDDMIPSRTEELEEMVTTPQIHRAEKEGVTPYAPQQGPVGNQSPGTYGGPGFLRRPRFERLRGSRLGSFSSRKSASNYELGIASGETPDRNGDIPMDSPISRRGSLLIDTTGLNISGNDSSDEQAPGKLVHQQPQPQHDQPQQPPSTPGVVRRAVTRRSNLLPKTKGFARVRAELLEETAPVDNEVKREAEVVRQVHKVTDVGMNEINGGRPGGGGRAASPPDLTPTIHPQHYENQSVVETSEDTSQAAPDELRGSSKEYHPHMYSNVETPPPGFFQRPRSSSAASEDMRMSDSPLTSTNSHNNSVGTPNGANNAAPTTETTEPSDTAATAATTSETFQRPSQPTPHHPTPLDLSRNAPSKKRCRDEDWDPASIKRRAVSPGMSVQSSPVLGQSPTSSTWPTGPTVPNNNPGWWGGPLTQAGSGDRQQSQEGGQQGQWRSWRENSVASATTTTSMSEERTSSAGTATASVGAANANANASTSGGNGSANGGRSDSTGNANATANEGGTRSGFTTPSLTPHLGPKRVGMQGYADTNEGLGKMSLS
ncbi:MAG: hypothetical protein M1831_001387 [Alyxoria varia]|nr:MAG: hypothetical protein M1831_001387 [Alyxoria varia]